VLPRGAAQRVLHLAEAPLTERSPQLVRAQQRRPTIDLPELSCRGTVVNRIGGVRRWMMIRFEKWRGRTYSSR
jgi:hypothetical protein